jgi:hypothetical protein
MLCVFLCCEARNRCPTALGGSGLVEVASCSQGGSSVVRRVGETFRRWEAASWSGEQRWRLNWEYTDVCNQFARDLLASSMYT